MENVFKYFLTSKISIFFQIFPKFSRFPKLFLFFILKSHLLKFSFIICCISPKTFKFDLWNKFALPNLLRSPLKNTIMLHREYEIKYALWDHYINDVARAVTCITCLDTGCDIMSRAVTYVMTRVVIHITCLGTGHDTMIEQWYVLWRGRWYE